MLFQEILSCHKASKALFFLPACENKVHLHPLARSVAEVATERRVHPSSASPCCRAEKMVAARRLALFPGRPCCDSARGVPEGTHSLLLLLLCVFLESPAAPTPLRTWVLFARNISHVAASARDSFVLSVPRLWCCSCRSWAAPVPQLSGLLVAGASSSLQGGPSPWGGLHLQPPHSLKR